MAGPWDDGPISLLGGRPHQMLLCTLHTVGQVSLLWALRPTWRPGAPWRPRAPQTCPSLGVLGWGSRAEEAVHNSQHFSFVKGHFRNVQPLEKPTVSQNCWGWELGPEASCSELVSG